MPSSLKASEPFSFGATDLAPQWSVWKRLFEWYIVAPKTNQTPPDEEVLVGVFMTLLGSEGLKFFDPFEFNRNTDARKIVSVLDKITAHFEPCRSEVFERFSFLRRHQLVSETFDTRLTELRGLDRSWGYGTGTESVLRDHIVLGIADPLVWEKLLCKKNLLLAKACEVVRACVSSKLQQTQINAPVVESAHALQVRQADRKPERKPGSQSSTGGTPDQCWPTNQRQSSVHSSSESQSVSYQWVYTWQK